MDMDSSLYLSFFETLRQFKINLCDIWVYLAPLNASNDTKAESLRRYGFII